jgi:hypothetical protein
MNKKLKLIFLSLLAGFFCVKTAAAQELLQFMNGQIEFATVVDTAGGIIKVKEYDSGKSKKSKRKKEDVVTLNKDDIFSIKYPQGTEVVYYKQDTLSMEDDRILSIDEMRSYLAGSHDAAARFKSSGGVWISFATGLASGLFLPVVISPVIPALVVGALGSRWVKVDRSHVSNTKYLGDDFYLMGYEKTARSKRINGSIGGAAAGLGLGLALSFTVFNQE